MTVRGEMSVERRLVLWLIVFAVVGSAVYALSSVLTPFVAGIAVAFLLDPLADRLERLGCPRGIAAALIVVGFLVIFIAILFLIVPAVGAQAFDFITRVPGYIESVREAGEPLLERLRSALTKSQLDKLNTTVNEHVGDVLRWLGQLLGGVLSGGAAVLNVVGLLLIMPIVAFYLLRDWDRMVAYIDSLLPQHEGDAIRDLLQEINDRLSGFVRGQIIVCLILAAWYATGLSLIGLDFGLLVGVLAGLISFIPFIGNIVGLLISVGLAVAQFDGWQPVALVVGVFVSGQILSDYIIAPRIIGDKVGLHPVWLIFAVIAGSTLLGFTGALLAVPAAAVIGVLVRFAIARYRQSPLYKSKPKETIIVPATVAPPTPGRERE